MPPIALTPVLATQSDARLVALAQQGHEPAFEALVRRYRPQLLAHCRRILSADAAEDALQYGLIGAWLALQNGSEVRAVRAWLHRVVHNAALRLRASAAGEAKVADIEPTVEGPEQALEHRHDLREALSAVARLPEQQRAALLLTAVEGETYDDAAEWLGISPTSLRGLVSRARAAVRAAATAVMPPPLLSWLLGRARVGGPAVSAGAPALGGMVVKGGAVLVAIGATAGAVAHVALPARPSAHAAQAVLAHAPRPPRSAGLHTQTAQRLRLSPASTATRTPRLRHRTPAGARATGHRLPANAPSGPYGSQSVGRAAPPSVPISTAPPAPPAAPRSIALSPPARVGSRPGSDGGSASPRGSTTSGGSHDGGGDRGGGGSPTPATSGGQSSDGGSSTSHDGQAAGGNDGSSTGGGDGSGTPGSGASSGH